MKILYCGVACGRRILCEQSADTTDYTTQVKDQLENFPQEYVTFELKG